MNRLKSISHLGFLLCFLIFQAGIATAQLSDSDRDTLDSWTTLADQAEQAIDAATAPNADLEQLRREIAEFREGFARGRDQNSVRIRTLQSQLDALGPEPEDGGEPTDLAELRASLNQQLDVLRVPQVVAEEAFNRSNGLISEIDRIVRERQASQLLARGPTPLNPSHWLPAIQEVDQAIVEVFLEIRTKWRSQSTRQTLNDTWPALLVTGLIGLLMVIKGPPWSERMGNYLRGLGGRGTGVWRFVVSLLRIVLPFAGVLLICTATIVSGLPGQGGETLLAAIPEWTLTYLCFRWLADRAFAPDSSAGLEFKKPHHRAEARIHVSLLGVMVVLHQAVQLFDANDDLTAATRAIISFPPILGSALILLRLQRIGMLQAKSPEDTDELDQSGASRSKILSGLRKAVVIFAVVSPILAVFGYTNAAEAIVYPAILTLFLISTFIVLQQFIGDIYGWLSGKGEAAQESLFIVLVGFALALLSLPILALIWGARLVDLTEMWERFTAGFAIGGVQVSPSNFITFVAIFAVGYSITKLIQGGLRTNLLPKTGIDAGGQNAIVSGTGYIGIFLAAVVAITGAGIDLSSLAIVAGALSVGIGFGLQTIVSNFVSGIILLVERPISKGDWIEVGGLMGYVRDISVRSTRIETFDRTDVIVPNSDLISGTVTNYTRGNTVGRVIAPVGVAYGTDTKKVEKILREIANAHPMVLAHPPPTIVFQGFGADSLDFEIRAILRDVNWVLSVKSDMNHEIARRFAEEAIEVPFSQRDIWLRNPEALPGAHAFTPSARHNYASDSPVPQKTPDDGEPGSS